jgi:hypothetical protein
VLHEAFKRGEDVVDLLALPKHHETNVYSPESSRDTYWHLLAPPATAIVRASPDREQQTAATELTPLHVEQGASPYALAPPVLASRQGSLEDSGAPWAFLLIALWTQTWTNGRHTRAADAASSLRPSPLCPF